MNRGHQAKSLSASDGFGESSLIDRSEASLRAGPYSTLICNIFGHD